MTRPIFCFTLIALVSLVFLGACSNGSPPSRRQDAPVQLGKREGKLNLVAPSGYVEDSSNESSVDWVHDFENTTKCSVSLTIEDDPQQLIEKMRSGKYDGTDGDALVSEPLIKSGDIAPINENLVPEINSVSSFVSNKSWNSKDSKKFGVPVSIGVYALTFDSDVISNPPKSWKNFYSTKKSKYSLTIPDNPIMIAQTALYLRATDSELKISSPFALDENQFKKVISTVKKQDKNVKAYWSTPLNARDIFLDGATAGAVPLSVIYALNNNNFEANTTEPEEGMIGFSDSWMISSRARNINCMYDWLNHVISPKVNATFSEYAGVAPTNPNACLETKDPNHCSLFHAQDNNYLSKITFITYPEEKCVDGRTEEKCVGYSRWIRDWKKLTESHTN